MLEWTSRALSPPLACHPLLFPVIPGQGPVVEAEKRVGPPPPGVVFGPRRQPRAAVPHINWPIYDVGKRPAGGKSRVSPRTARRPSARPHPAGSSPALPWIPACAGMTEGDESMTEKSREHPAILRANHDFRPDDFLRLVELARRLYHVISIVKGSGRDIKSSGLLDDGMDRRRDRGLARTRITYCSRGPPSPRCPGTPFSPRPR